jgi:hypothetical protein
MLPSGNHNNRILYCRFAPASHSAITQKIRDPDVHSRS